MQSLTVLTPHARRMVVKVDGNKTLLWILETVCEKYPEFEAENYVLKRNNKEVDLSQHFRFSGLPNNCTLEMIETDKKRTEQDVMICLQLEDGTRLNGNYKPSRNLREIITEMCPEKSEDNPVVIYMRNEIFGEELNKTTLKSLGVSGGRVLLRLINSDPESLKVQANVSAPLPQKPRLEESSSSEKPKTRPSEAGPSGAFQFKKVDQLKEKEIIQLAEEKMEIEEDKPEEIKAVPETPSTITSAAATEVEEEKEPEAPPVINLLDDRGTIIFSLDSISTQSMDLPDSFFELTESDVRIIYRELRQTVDSNENAPLMTEGLRKLEENKKILNQLAAYKNCAIRIQLPNRHVIQTKFSTVETIGAVKEFVKNFLINPEMKFFLFVTPPKTILENDLTLVESNCVPSALLHFGTEENCNELLKPEYYQKLSTATGASKVLLSHKSSEAEAENNNNNQAGPSGVKSTTTSAVPKNFMESKASSKPTGAIPKWFKPTK